MSVALTLSLALFAPAAPTGFELGPDDGRPRVAVLALSHDDSVSAELAARVSGELRASLLQQTRFQMVAGDELSTVLNNSGAQGACDDSACLKKVAASVGADLVVFGRVRHEEGTPVLEGFVYDASSQRVLPAGRITGYRALDRQGSAELSEQLYATASSTSGAGPRGWMTSPWMGLGVTLTALGVVATIAAVGTAGFAYWVFFNTYLDVDVRRTAGTVIYVAATAVPVAALVALSGAGVMAGTFLLVE
jgi:TolB-like protein